MKILNILRRLKNVPERLSEHHRWRHQHGRGGHFWDIEAFYKCVPFWEDEVQHHPSPRKHARLLRAYLYNDCFSKAMAIYEKIRAIDRKKDDKNHGVCAWAACQCVCCIDRIDIEIAEGCYQDITALKQTDEVRKQRSKAAACLVFHSVKTDIAMAERYYREISGLKQTDAIQREQAQAAACLVFHVSKTDIAQAKRYYRDIAALKQTCAVQKERADAACWLIFDVAKTDLAGAEKYYRDICEINLSSRRQLFSVFPEPLFYGPDGLSWTDAIQEARAEAARGLVFYTREIDISAAERYYRDIVNLEQTEAVQEQREKAARYLALKE